MSGFARLGMVFGLFFLLVACGDGDDISDVLNTSDAALPDSTDGTGTDPGTGTDGTQETVVLGSGSGTSFIAGKLALGVTDLSAGGITSVSASLADANGNLRQEVDSISFTSGCAATGLAIIDSPVSTSGGVATSIYEAQGCSGSDTITATVTVNSTTLTATGALTVQPAIIGSLQFISAVPTDIGIKGFGLIEVSKVTFKALDTNGNSVAGEAVTFELNTDVGGISLSDTSLTSDNAGLVQIDVQSGTITTVARVTATLVSNPAIKTQSDGLVISTGIADQDSMSVSVSTKNPEAWAIDGNEVSVTVHASDHFGNPVPDGTAVSFTAEGGQIQPQCLINGGSCSVTWTSTNPRPADGRATLLATMIGEETFVDANGNGVLDNLDTFTDIPEAFRDNSEDGVFNLGSEEFLDFNTNGSYDGVDGAFNGVLCCDAAAVASASAGDACFGVTPTSLTCSSAKNIHVRGQAVLGMARSGLTIDSTDASLNGAGGTIATTIVSVYGIHTDLSSQVPPAGTTISISVTNGTLESSGSVTVPSTNVPGPYDVLVRWKGDAEPSSGTLKVEATVPSGLISGPLFIDLDD